MELGKLNKVDLRTAWKNEASDFTTWLSKEENLALLADEIGISIVNPKTEVDVGRFSADIVAEEESANRKIIIENQLETTNHDHLGKLITYASGHDAKTIIWVVKEVREEHRQAIDWLNEHTDDETSFFAIKIELYQIGNSPLAPKFEIISQPNDWAKTIKSVGRSEVTDTKAMQHEFWNKFKEYAQARKTKLKLTKTYPQHWYNISVGSSKAHISLTLNTQANQIACEIYIPDSKNLFNSLIQHKEAIEKELGSKLEWQPLEGKKASRIKISKEGDLTNQKEWENYFEWLKTQSEKLHTVFSRYIKIAQ